MTKYRDLLVEQYDTEIGSIVGCGLDRLGRECVFFEINAALHFFAQYKDKLSEMAIGDRRQAVCDYISSGGKIPNQLNL